MKSNNMKEPTAFQNFRWDILDWVADHGWLFVCILLAYILLHSG